MTAIDIYFTVNKCKVRANVKILINFFLLISAFFSLIFYNLLFIADIMSACA